MYTACQEALIKVLKAAGCGKEPFISKKRMELSGESRVSAVLCEEDAVERSAGRKFYTAEDGRGHKRKKLYDRNIAFSVVIGDYDFEKAEKTYENFLRELPAGIYADGNYITIEPSNAQWMGEKDHILNAKVAVQLMVNCHGGLYKDSDTVKLKDVEVTTGKET